MSNSESEEAFDWGPGLDEDSDLVTPGASPEAHHRESGVLLTAVIGGVYVMWALGWVIGLAQTPAPLFSGWFEAVMFGFGRFLAYIAAPLWFVTVLWLGSQWTPRRRGGVLVLGLIALLPWPLLLPAVLA